ncbi:MAG: MgtC/SapB family protein [Anaerolineae bacterium]
MTFLPEDLFKILLAILVGGLIGAEREYRDKAAGFRTIIFICIGATLFTIFSVKLAGDKEPTRIAANIVSGIGFLGAGVILHDRGRIMGLTTASTIWLAAALGMGIGGGHYLLSLAATGIISIVLWIFPRFEHWMSNVHETRAYEIVCPTNEEKFRSLDALFRECDLQVRRAKRVKSGDCMLCTWDASGSPRDHERLMERLFADPDVREFRY